jgi:drug/metabolite transporter (DMT)-like permease
MTASLIWLPAALFAGLFQAWRTALQKRARDTLSVNAAGLVRYLFGLPVAALLLAGYSWISGAGALPVPGPRFLWMCALAGIAQILATNLLIMAFGYRNFVVGTAYSKTEAVQGAILAMLLTGERLHPLAWAGVVAGVVGIMLLSTGGQRMRPLDFVRALGQPAALCGLGAGFLFAVTALAIRDATGTLATDDLVLAALIALVTTMAIQTVLQGSYVVVREPAEVGRIIAGWRTAGMVGLLAALGSACWFTGFATAPVALVRIVGQVEIIFTLGFARFYLRESLSATEVAGLLLVGSGVVLALVSTLW